MRASFKLRFWAVITARLLKTAAFASPLCTIFRYSASAVPSSPTSCAMTAWVKRLSRDWVVAHPARPIANRRPLRKRMEHLDSTPLEHDPRAPASAPIARAGGACEIPPVRGTPYWLRGAQPGADHRRRWSGDLHHPGHQPLQHALLVLRLLVRRCAAARGADAGADRTDQRTAGRPSAASSSPSRAASRRCAPTCPTWSRCWPAITTRCSTPTAGTSTPPRRARSSTPGWSASACRSTTPIRRATTRTACRDRSIAPSLRSATFSARRGAGGRSTS